MRQSRQKREHLGGVGGVEMDLVVKDMEVPPAGTRGLAQPDHPPMALDGFS